MQVKNIVWSAVITTALIVGTVVCGVLGQTNLTLGFGLGAVALATLST
jgi:hypothetical protein